MSVKTDWKKEMYGLHQSPEGGVKPSDSNSLEAALKELREETELRLHHSRVKWIDNDDKFDCDIQYMQSN